MHDAQVEFCRSIWHKFFDHFTNSYVLDCGSLDINGNNRYMFHGCFYIGVDIKTGKNVHMKSLIHKVAFVDSVFDVVLSTNAFEHDKHWKASLKTMVRILKPGGLMFFTCGRAWHEHGTDKKSPHASPATRNYYRNLNEKLIRRTILVGEIFSEYEFSTSRDGRDLFFWGVKK